MVPLPTILYLRRRVWQTLSLDELFLVGAIQPDSCSRADSAHFAGMEQ